MIRKLIRYIRVHRRLPTIENFRKRHREAMPLPSLLQIEPTVACNFRCRFCPNSEVNQAGQAGGRHMPLSLFRKIVDEVPTLREIKLQGLGEPLLCPDVRAMMEHGHAKGIVFNMVSNGTLVRSRLPELMPYLRRFVISFDTFNQRLADRNKAGFDVERCKADVREMVSIRRERNPRCVVGITTVVTHENVEEVPEILRFAAQAGVDYAGFVAVENWKTPGEAGFAGACQYAAEARKVVSMERIRELHGQEGYRFQLGLLDFSPRKSACYWMFDSAYITYDGHVTPCCVRPNPQVIQFGNVAQAPFGKIWNGPAAREFRRTHLRGTPNPICDRCPG